MPLLSDPESPTKQELEAIEKIIFDQDLPTPLRQDPKTKLAEHPSSDTLTDDVKVQLGDIYSPLASVENTPPSIEAKRFKREDLKVEEPLTPGKPTVTPLKSVRFSDIIEELELESNSRTETPALDNSFFEEAFGDALRKANQQAEQEKLVEADATARVEIPIMDFSKSDPPWKKFEKIQNKATLLSLQMSFMREVLGQSAPKNLPSKNKDFNLKWTPLPREFAKVVEDENFEDNGILDTFMESLNSEIVIDSSDLTWKPPGLRISRDDEDDDDVELGQFRRDTPRDLSFLAKKRKMDLEEASGLRGERLAKRALPAGQTVASPRDLSANTSKPNEFSTMAPLAHTEIQSVGGTSGLLLGGLFSVENSLDTYFELRGTKKAKLSDSTCFSPKPNLTQPPSAAQALRTTTPQLGTIQLPIRKSPLAKLLPLPAPSLPAASTAASVIISSTLLKHRALIKHLERMLPALSLVERDFMAHNTMTWMPGSVTRSPIRSPLDSEADIIVSSSTGIVITTLQKIKQKPLPGQKGKSAIRERLEQVGARYEKLVVLVAESRDDETTIELDESDSLALTEFVGFSTGFETSISVLFVAGGEETLAKWLASIITQRCVVGELSLLAEETHWELFLRRAGLNAFAAQAIIAELKAPDGVDAGSPTKAGQFGLTAFVEMGREQRIGRFSPLCGRVLMERVSAVIDGTWE